MEKKRAKLCWRKRRKHETGEKKTQKNVAAQTKQPESLPMPTNSRGTDERQRDLIRVGIEKVDRDGVALINSSVLLELELGLCSEPGVALVTCTFSTSESKSFLEVLAQNYCKRETCTVR